MCETYQTYIQLHNDVNNAYVMLWLRVQACVGVHDLLIVASACCQTGVVLHYSVGVTPTL